MYRFSRPQQHQRRPLVVAGVIVLILLLGVGGFLYMRERNQTATATKPGVGEVSGINYNPPTEEEKQTAEDNKQKAVDQMNTEAESTPAGEKKTVTPIISSANQNGSQVEVYSYISGVTEDNGTCTFTFTKGSGKVIKTSKGVRDATTTICTPTRFPSSELGSTGTWSVRLQYSSATASGESAAKTFEVN